MSKTFLRLTPGAVENGLITFRLALWVGDTERAHWPVNSGARGAQVLRAYHDPQSRPGSLEPIPEAEYGVGVVEWAGGAGNWAASWGPGLGPVWISIFDPGGSRGEFGFHLDSNRATSPGSAGCIVFSTQGRLESFLAAFREFGPQRLVVDYKLSSAGLPTPIVPAAKQTLEVVAHSGKLRARWNGSAWRDLDSLKISADYK